MLKPLSQPRHSPGSSPGCRYAPARPPSASPSSRRLSKPVPQAEKQEPKPPHISRYVDAGTQWSPILNSTTRPRPVEANLQPVKPEVPQVNLPADSRMAPPAATEPVLKSDTPSTKRRQSGDEGSTLSSNQSSSPKRSRPPQAPVKTLPARYELCEVEDMVILIAAMISELIQRNDGLPLRTGVLTRFHSRTPPGISVLDYLQRLAKHATLTPPLLLSMVYYIDRLCLLYPAFTITTLTVHRFLITAATVAAKGLSDSFWNNATYARVGGIKIAELGLLELDFLYRVDWKIVPNPEVLVDYYRALVERADGYEMESESNSSEDEEQEESDDGKATSPPSTSAEKRTDEQWRAWMEDVSIQRAEGEDDRTNGGAASNARF